MKTYKATNEQTNNLVNLSYRISSLAMLLELDQLADGEKDALKILREKATTHAISNTARIIQDIAEKQREILEKIKAQETTESTDTG